MKGITGKDIEEALELCTQTGKCTKCAYREYEGVCYIELHKDAYYYIQRLKRRAKLPQPHTRAPMRGNTDGGKTN